MDQRIEDALARLRARLAAEPALGPALATLLGLAALLPALLVLRATPLDGVGTSSTVAGALPADPCTTGAPTEGVAPGALPAGQPERTRVSGSDGDDAPGGPDAIDAAVADRAGAAGAFGAASSGGGWSACPGQPHAPSAGAAAASASRSAGTAAVLTVHVAGAVVRAGIVELALGARVADAVVAAGGLRVDADVDALNLARPLVDGEQVRVPRVGDPTPPPPAVSDVSAGPLDLNRATASQLEALDGIGPVLAARIVDHRERHGPFADLASLREVSGIGERTWLRLAPQLVVP